ncbi:MAG: DUF488 family protein [Nitrososphaerota archaeon]|nr:DUF488 family protein [Nitrososphaerota archaeon]MDG6923872.1 DUF488 family protein [Nitrososphaerota archaeon]
MWSHQGQRILGDFWIEVTREYKKVLHRNAYAIRNLAKLSREGDVTLLCSCKDSEHCHRKLLAEELRKMI